MICKLNEADRFPLMTMLHKDPILHMFIVGMWRIAGSNGISWSCGGEMDEPARTDQSGNAAVLWKLFSVCGGSFDVEGFAELVRKSGKSEMLSGSSHVLREFGQVQDRQSLATEVVARLCADVLMCWKRARRINLQKAGVHRYRTWSVLYK
ncbi:hypothetical protein [Paenibacillus sp. FSL R10-2771]|uniref:hypothetical protein n=1 Tax=Paenibacillus sp. FSL R10-2771 TaxID=2954693 RepID=UPI0030FCEE3A